MGMGIGFFVAARIVVEPAGPGGPLRLMDQEPAGHAQMHQQEYVAFRQVREDVFGPAANRGDALAGQALGEAFGERKTQVRAIDLNPGEMRALHDAGQAARHGFDFRQFRHFSPSSIFAAR